MIIRRLNLLIAISLFSAFAGFSQKIADRELNEFKSVKIVGQIQTVLTPGDENKIHIEAEDVEVEKITTEIEDEELTVKLLKHLFKDPTIFVKITYKSIEEVNALADAEITFDKPIIQPNFKLKSSSGAKIELSVDTKLFDVEAFQGGQVVVKGETENLNGYVNTGGILSGTDLKCNRVNIRLNTGGKGELTIKDYLEASVNTGADFSYYGVPSKKDVSKSLGGTISAWDED
jgi:hypothetical protein